MKFFLEAPGVALFRPSILKGERDLKTRLFPPNAAPIVSEGRIVLDNSMPTHNWARFEAPSFERIDARSVCARQISQLRKAG